MGINSLSFSSLFPVVHIPLHFEQPINLSPRTAHVVSSRMRLWYCIVLWYGKHNLICKSVRSLTKHSKTRLSGYSWTCDYLFTFKVHEFLLVFQVFVEFIRCCAFEQDVCRLFFRLIKFLLNCLSVVLLSKMSGLVCQSFFKLINSLFACLWRPEQGYTWVNPLWTNVTKVSHDLNNSN